MKPGAALQGSPTRRAEPIARPAEQGSARPVFCFPQCAPTREESMYATIRRYSVRDAAKATDTMRDLTRRVEKNFLPMLQDVQGFHGYYVLNANDRELVTISIFESAAGAQES